MSTITAARMSHDELRARWPVTRIRPLRGLIVLAVALLTASGGCESDKAPPPSETCAKVGDTCKLPAGPLGICNSAPCKPGATPPCLRCTPQH